MRLKPIGRPQSNPSNSGYPRLKDGFELVSWRDLPTDCIIVHHPLITRRIIRAIHDPRSMNRLAPWGSIESSRTARLLVQTRA